MCTCVVEREWKGKCNFLGGSDPEWLQLARREHSDAPETSLRYVPEHLHHNNKNIRLQAAEFHPHDNHIALIRPFAQHDRDLISGCARHVYNPANLFSLCSVPIAREPSSSFLLGAPSGRGRGSGKAKRRKNEDK